jgi:hypothetical protein
MEKYILRESKDGGVFYIISQENLSEIDNFQNLQKGLEIVENLFHSYITQKEHSEKEEYESLIILLDKIICLFTVVYPPLTVETTDNEKSKDFLLEAIHMFHKASELRQEINYRFFWYSQETVGPFCFKKSQGGSSMIGIQLHEVGVYHFFKELYKAENFLIQEINKKTITREEYDRLDKNIRKIFSEIQGN